LADLGADVIRIERPQRDRIVPDDFSGAGDGANPWDVLSRSRERIAVDLRDPRGVALVTDLVARADVIIEGFRPGVVERLGVGPDALCAVNERLIYARMTGYGREGPRATEAGHDLNYLAVAGVLAHIGRVDQPPSPPLNLVGDFGGGAMLLVAGILAALVERSTSGSGQIVDAAMVDGAALLMASLYGAYSSGYWSADRGTNLLDGGAPFYDCYECADGTWLSVAAIEPAFYAAFLDGIGVGTADLPDQHDQSRWPELRSRIAAAVLERTRDEWCAVFEGVDACVAPVLTMGEAPHDPHAVARGAFVDQGGVFQPAPAPRFSRTVPDQPAVGRDVGDPHETLGRWGVATERIDDLVDAGVVGP
ncbi:MAG: CaiB/BaiF CoA transferase family protein, partial [Actinomycetes bacterium]